MDCKENNIMENDIRTTTLQIQMPMEGYLISKQKGTCFVSAIVILIVLAFILAILLVSASRKPSCIDELSLPELVIDEKKVFDGRLPDNLVPINYLIKLTPYLDEVDGGKMRTFDGSVRIEARCARPTSKITLHAQYLDINRDSIQIKDSELNSLEVRDVSTDELYNFYVISTYPALQKEKVYVIEMNYVGSLNNTDLVGFYISTYAVGNTTRTIAVSQLETTFARMVFPAFDEPRYKATFDIVITHRVGRTAVSNMPVILTEVNGDWLTVTFDTSPIMSTYLVGLTVTDFAFRETTTANGVKMRVWARNDRIESAVYALETGSKMLTFLEELWDIPYPLSKLDMLAAPEFRFGAMENWGIVIYAEQRMLYNVSSDNPPTGQQVAMIIGHELVHQWFGNMVTMDWWSDTWLNEAFASYFEFVAVDEVEPTWDIFEQFFQGDATFMALQDDAEADSHPTVMDVGWLPDIWKMFDSRGYQRGACMARMMQAFLGDEVFYEGLRNYVRDFMYKNAVSDDVYRYLTEASIGRSNVDVKEVMDPWMLQKGYPLVTITRTTDTTAVADQKPYSNDPNGEGFGPSWYVPLTYTHSGRMIVDNPKHVWMRKSSADLELSDAEDDDWILGNINQLGFFRVNYDADNWEKLIAQLIEDHKKIPLANRAALVDDVFSMSQSMDIDAVTALRVGYYLKKEEDYTPIKAVIIHLDFFKSMLERTTAYGYYKKYIQNMFRPMYDKLGWNFTYENHVDYHLRKSAVESACYTDYGPCIDTATSIYKRWIDGQGEYKIADDIIEVVMCSAIKAGTENDWRFALSMLHSTSALACTKDFTLIKEYMEESLHMSDIFTTLGYIKQQSAIGYHLAWEFLMDNFELLVHVKEESAYKAVWEFAGNMNRGKDLAMLEQFGRTYSHMPSLEVSSFYQSLNKVKLNIAWMDKNYNAVYDWLKGISAEDG